MSDGPDASAAAAHKPTPRRLAVLVGAALATAVLGGAAAFAVTSGSASGPAHAAASAPVPTPTASVVGLAAGRAPWEAPLRLAVSDATVLAVTVTDPDGAGVPGTLTPAGWTSGSTLVPAATYTASLTVRDALDRVRVLPLTARTTAATSVVKAALSPGDDNVVGVGKAVQVTLDKDVTDRAARDAVVSRLVVSASPAVPGAWRWMDSRTIHYRPAQFWEPGTKVSVRVDLQRLSLPGGTWGSGVRTTHFTVGDATISTVDVAAHTMTVRRNGTVLRVMKASMGKPQFATRNGTFLVLEKFEKKIMDSATVDLPPGTPAYKTAVEHAVRITNSGTFTHGAPWSLASQGVANVSHGCINLSPADAGWFYDLARRGDVVKVVGSTREANTYDDGSRDWNMSFADWQA